MYEFHGWVCVWAGDPDVGGDAEAAAAMVAIRARLDAAEREIGGWFEVRYASNAQIVVAHGLRNHCPRRGGLLELFAWIGEQYPLSHGLLYVHDQESSAWDRFVAYRLAHGALTECANAPLPVVDAG